MAGNSPIRYAKVRRALLRGGAEEGRVTGSHHQWIWGAKSYSFPVHSGQVKAGYVRRLRSDWNLTPADGVSDSDFWEGNWGG